MEEKLIAVVKAPCEKPRTVAIAKGLKPLQEFVGGTICAADIPNMDDIFGFCNDEGLLIGLEPNFYRPEYGDGIVGTAVFLGAGDDGDSISLTPEQAKKVTRYLEENSADNFLEFWKTIESGFENYKPKTQSYCIYQLKSNLEQFLFEPYKRIERTDHNLTEEDYDMVYVNRHNGETLDQIYERFNINRPKDFAGHSLSVSDVIVLIKNDERTAYFVDDYGFRKLPDFFNTGGAAVLEKVEMEM